jgi:hypothetical protein
VCLFDPRHARVKVAKATRMVSEKDYFAHEHVIVSYNGDLRGVAADDDDEAGRFLRGKIESIAEGTRA